MIINTIVLLTNNAYECSAKFSTNTMANLLLTNRCVCLQKFAKIEKITKLFQINLLKVYNGGQLHRSQGAPELVTYFKLFLL